MVLNAISAYFIIHPNKIYKYRATLCTDDNVDILSKLNIIVLGVFTPGDKKIVKCMIPPYLFKSLQELSGEEHPFSPAGMIAMNLPLAYLGRTLEDIFERFPGLRGKKTEIDSEGNEYLVWKFPRSKWAFE